MLLSQLRLVGRIVESAVAAFPAKTVKFASMKEATLSQARLWQSWLGMGIQILLEYQDLLVVVIEPRMLGSIRMLVWYIIKKHWVDVGI